MTDGLRSYSGVLNVHSDRSGGYTVDHLLAVAREAGLDFVVLTDTNVSREEMESLEGWHNGVLLLAGEKVLTPEGNFLALRTGQEIGMHATLDSALRAVADQQALSVGVGYHYDPRHLPALVPPAVSMARVDMVEVWSFLDEFLSTVPGNRALQFHARPERCLFGPPRRLLRAWDTELQRRLVPAVGGVNARCRKEPLLEWKEFFPYNSSFRTIRTMALCREFARGDLAAARQAIFCALAGGRSYVYNHSLGKTAGFRFEYEDAYGQFHGLGETARYLPKSHLHVEFPAAVEFVLRCDGLPLFWGTGHRIAFPLPCPGVFRVEAYIDKRLWILSNPIRIMMRVADPDKPVTVYDFT
jgi:hypothetical protein